MFVDLFKQVLIKSKISRALLEQTKLNFLQGM